MDRAAPCSTLNRSLFLCSFPQGLDRLPRISRSQRREGHTGKSRFAESFLSRGRSLGRMWGVLGYRQLLGWCPGCFCTKGLPEKGHPTCSHPGMRSLAQGAPDWREPGAGKRLPLPAVGRGGCQQQHSQLCRQQLSN